MKREFISIEEAAASTGRSASTIWRWIRVGDLAAYDVGGRTRVRRVDLAALFEPEPSRIQRRGGEDEAGEDDDDEDGEGEEDEEDDDDEEDEEDDGDGEEDDDDEDDDDEDDGDDRAEVADGDEDGEAADLKDEAGEAVRPRKVGGKTKERAGKRRRR